MTTEQQIWQPIDREIQAAALKPGDHVRHDGTCIVWSRHTCPSSSTLNARVITNATNASNVTANLRHNYRHIRQKRNKGRRRLHSDATRSFMLLAVTMIVVSSLLLLPPALVDAFILFNPTSFSTILRKCSLPRTRHDMHLHYQNEATQADTSTSTLPPLQKHPHFLENNSDKRSFPISPAVASVWESIVPKADLVGTLFGGNKVGGGRQMRRGILGADVTVQFDDPADGAAQLLRGCGIDHKDDDVRQHLTNVLSYYQDIVSFKAGDNKRMCKTRIVASRGPIGTKCPRWHLDHVPVRLILSLVGPGCVYIPESLSSATRHSDGVLVNREALNGLELDDTVRANRIIVPDETGAVHSGPGEAIVLMGREWDTVEDEDAAKGGEILHAAAHKSPSLAPFEGRVLLTVDLVMDP